MMSEIIVAAIAFCGTLCGTFGGIITANRLTNFRIEQLEKRVEQHNSVVERTYILEEKMKAVNRRLENLEAFEHEVMEDAR
ncbi:MAG TPA: hypothetical protein IAB00_02860 [Candidatus Avidehalobacter gallistercoris]|uniref:Uncharacterized protein n=1 Tax=Candidatus Avidehalobacter gallistercoris TaxID=2840694 RepID=A0A9D1HLM4_9FIRM|nr:hypothetical protein [Candidatus Avidehalobacter gallistercoris]